MNNVDKTVRDIFEELIRRIQKDGKVKIISDEFSKIKIGSDRVTFVYGILEKYKLFPELIIDEKSDEIAIKWREDGNKKFKEKKLREALNFYTRSLVCAPIHSDSYSKAIANKSAVLFELELYEECIKDIETALNHNYPQDLQQKILKRKTNAISKLVSNKNAFNYFKNPPEIPDDFKSPSIQCSSNALRIRKSDFHGRYVTAAKTIEIGEVLAIERPFCSVLCSELFTHCHECLKLCYNLLPCPLCTQALYCSGECRERAEVYHSQECAISKTLRSLKLDKLKLLPLKIAVSMKPFYRTSRTAENDVYRSDRYIEIDELVTNEAYRSVADLFERSTTAAVIFQLLRAHTNFFDCQQDEVGFKELLLKHLQTAPCNFHEISELDRSDDGYFESKEIGAGAYAFLSLFNHSCNPNVVRHCHGTDIVLRAIRRIEEGEQCFDNYGYHFAVMSKRDRQTNLKKQYFFDCNCYVCENDWPMLYDLPALNYDTGVSEKEIDKLRKGDGTISTTVSAKLLEKFKQMELDQPNRVFFEMQEVLKQCFALLGNVRKK